MNSFIPTKPDSHFPIQNLPYGVFRPQPGAPPRVGVAIGEMVLDLSVLEERGLFEDESVRNERPFSRSSLNLFLSLGRSSWNLVRETLTHLLDERTPTLRTDEVLKARAFFLRHEVEMLLPAAIGDYTDFYSSREHATNVGTMFRGRENALQPNWLHLPVGYHGRASSIVVSGTDVRRPCGQVLPKGATVPAFAETAQLDFELEMGFLVGPGNSLGEPIPVDRAEEHIFGFVLVNDWSARDIQSWEYVPLGPFLGKNFATTVSPWVVTAVALATFRVPGPKQEPRPLPYLSLARNLAYDIELQVSLETDSLGRPYTISRSNARHLYWSFEQQLAHHTVNGCNLRPGDLIASGTISGPTPDSLGSLLELTWRGEHPIELPGGERRSFLEDGDRVVMSAWAEGAGFRIGFGDASGRILPARV
ncbi:MAG: fumarylacetoacetase [Rhodothermales bacterium]